MYHTWFRLFFCIVLCCPVAVAAQGGQDSSDETFRKCVLDNIFEWKKECATNEKNAPSVQPYDNNSNIEKALERLEPRKRSTPWWGPVWGPTPAEVYRKYYFPDQQK